MELSGRRYPIGIQNFEQLRTRNCVYVDKTELVYKLVNTDQIYFFSRPCRFGKSLLVSTLEAYFQGKKELFEGLAMERLEQEENGTKSLITDISHQLKTPLASLRMSHELVAENRVTGEEQREFLEQESQELTKLEQLLNELVNLSRLETHMIQIHSLHESLKKTLTEAVSQIYMKARGKDISIQVEMDDDIVVNHDSKWTVEALTNILENAVKYSPEHTTITVRTQELASNVLIEVSEIVPGKESKGTGKRRSGCRSVSCQKDHRRTGGDNSSQKKG